MDGTPASYTITTENWKVVALNEHVFFFQRGYEPVVWSEDTSAYQKMSAHSHAVGTPPQANEALAAFGRLFVADFTNDKHTVYWSDLLDGTIWTGGSSGSIDVDKAWPRGTDEIVALAQHNNRLVIFGRKSILIYSGADTPSTMELVDQIDSMGCIARDSVQNTGSDILFLSQFGVQSLGRLIQEQSAPMRDISRNVRNDLTALVAAEAGHIKSTYNPKEAFYLLSLPTSGYVYCFDMRGMLEDGSARVTVWDNIEPLCFHTTRSGALYMGHASGISQYTGYQDNGGSYEFQYFSNPISFGNPTLLKFLKKLAMTIIGGSGVTSFMKWAYDYQYNYRSVQYTLSGGDVAEYGIAEYGIDEYTSGTIISRPSANTGGSGYVVTIGLTANIDGYPLSIQQIDILALVGRLI